MFTFSRENTSNIATSTSATNKFIKIRFWVDSSASVFNTDKFRFYHSKTVTNSLLFTVKFSIF